MFDLLPGETVVRELSPAEWLPVLRTDLDVCRARIRMLRRDGCETGSMEEQGRRIMRRIAEMESE